MKWLRSLTAELFPTWHERRLLRQLTSRNEAGLAALKDLIRTVEMNNRAANVPAKKPEAAGTRSAKADPDRKNTAGGPKAPKTGGAPVRDVREEPAANPDGGSAGHGGGAR